MALFFLHLALLYVILSQNPPKVSRRVSFSCLFWSSSFIPFQLLISLVILSVSVRVKASGMEAALVSFLWSKYRDGADLLPGSSFGR